MSETDTQDAGRAYIPGEQAQIFAYLASLPETEKSSLFRALASVGRQLYPIDDIERLLRPFAREDTSSKEITTAIYALLANRQHHAEVSDAVFVEKIVKGVSVESPNVSKEGLQALVVNLLGLSDLALSLKATRVDMDTERHMHDACIYSDLRAVFDVSGSEVEAVVMIHTLKIDFHDGDKSREMYLRIDDADMATLESAVRRARKKDAALRNFVKRSGAHVIGGKK